VEVRSKIYRSTPFVGVSQAASARNRMLPTILTELYLLHVVLFIVYSIIVIVYCLPELAFGFGVIRYH
jgi:hypothetical protein